MLPFSCNKENFLFLEGSWPHKITHQLQFLVSLRTRQVHVNGSDRPDQILKKNEHNLPDFSSFSLAGIWMWKWAILRHEGEGTTAEMEKSKAARARVPNPLWPHTPESLWIVKRRGKAHPFWISCCYLQSISANLHANIINLPWWFRGCFIILQSKFKTSTWSIFKLEGTLKFTLCPHFTNEEIED